MKDKARLSRVQYVERTAPATSEGYDDMTPECYPCGEEHVGVGVPVFLMIPGMLFPSREYDVPVFIPDPDAQIITLTMPNGQMGMVTDQAIVKVAHGECIVQLIEEVHGDDPVEEEDEEDDQ